MPPVNKTDNLLRCYCNTDKCVRDTQSTCWTDGVCFASVTKSSGNEPGSVRYGCIAGVVTFPKYNPIYCQQSNLTSTQCCRKEFCNQHLLPSIPALASTESPANTASHGLSDTAVIAIGIVSGVLLIILLLFLGLLIRRRFAKAGENWSKTTPTPSFSLGSRTSNCDLSSNLSDLNSGSGAGYPLLVERTVSMDIQLQTVVGKGRYGEVWRGVWKGEDVAVKIFHSREEQSWFREAEIYQTTLLQHTNILRFVAADNKDSGTWTQLWLVTEYHPAGSLFDYLNTRAVTTGEMLKLCESIVSGLSHLHVDIRGTSGKPAIAHRDLKSKNILVKSDGACCIADLGLAVRHSSMSSQIDIAHNTRVGTRRYMAPEVLMDSIDVNNFEALKAADIYSLALVLWEILNRCYQHEGDIKDYELPYHDMVDSDPTDEEMYEVVVVERKRPALSMNAETSEILRAVSQIITESWSHSPTARLSILRIRKSLAELRTSNTIL